jgi:hypothetical protein
MQAVAPLQKDVHAKVKINDSNMAHVQDQHIAPVILHEFTRLAAEYPVAFVKNVDTGQFQSVCILGVKPKQNCFIKLGQWQGGYVPMSLRQAPFFLVPAAENAEQLIVGINETSPRVDLEQGQALFSDTGEETDYLKMRRQALIDYFEDERVSQQITHYLASLGLLIEQEISLSVAGENVKISGVYIVNEEKLGALSDEEFSSLRKKGVLPAIYAQLISLQQLQRLALLAS